MPQVNGIQVSGITTLNGVSVNGLTVNVNGVSIAFGGSTPTNTPTRTVTPTVTPTDTPAPTITPTPTLGALTRVMINGSFNNINSDTRYYIARANKDGSTDTSYPNAAYITAFDATVGAQLRPQSDGKQIIGGSFTTYNGVSVGYICRLWVDGVLDTSFNSGGAGFNNAVSVIWVNSDNTILVGGLFTTYNGTSSNRIIKLNSDGTINGTFNIGTGFDGQVEVIKKYGSYYYIGGNFTTYKGTSYVRFIILDDSGNVIGPNVGNGVNGQVFDLVVNDAQTEVYIGGDFTQWNGVNFGPDLVKVSTSTWSADATFNTNINGGTNNSVRGLLWDESTSVLYVGGNFTTFSGSSSFSRLVALNSDGTSFTTFNGSKTIPSNFIRKMNWSNISPNEFYIMGAFTDYGGNAARDRIALISKTNGAINSFACTIFGGPGQEPFWAYDFSFVSITPTPSITTTSSPTVTPTKTLTPTNTPTNTVTPTPTQTVPTGCNTIALVFGNSLDDACFGTNSSNYDINGTNLSNSSIIYDTGFSCASGKEASTGYYDDGSTTVYWNGSTISGVTCPPCNQVIAVYDSTSDRLACYGNNTVSVYINGNDFSDPITRLWNSCNVNNPAANGYYYDTGSSTLVYWDGSTVTKPSCPPCYQHMLHYDGTTPPTYCSFCIGSGNPYYTDNATFASSTGIYTDCTFQTTASSGYYSDACLTGADVYYWNGSTLTYDSTCP